MTLCRARIGGASGVETGGSRIHLCVCVRARVCVCARVCMCVRVRARRERRRASDVHSCLRCVPTAVADAAAAHDVREQDARRHRDDFNNSVAHAVSADRNVGASAITVVCM